MILLLASVASVRSQNSQGVYRIPYASGTSVRITSDHLTHNPTNQIDMVGTGGTEPYRIVAAGDGIIRYIVDTNTISCTTNGCAAFNNYVWIEHPNGEWTKYSHMRTGTTKGKAGLSVGTQVCAGTYLGDEGDIGRASGEHLHFEVAVPTNPRDPINPVGGFIKGVNLIPRVCEIGTLVDGDTYVAEPCLTTEVARGVYRIPYANGTDVTVTGDHLTHANVPNRIDMVGTGGQTPYKVVAAADGIVRFIVDTNTITCTTNGCSDFNNYIWLEHPNGEWTKYTHLQTGTITGAAKLKVGDAVCAGQYLGDEDDVGAATGRHLHFEVGVPDDLSDPINTVGGFIRGQNRIPVICGIPGNIFVDGQRYTAGPCSANACPDGLLLGVQAIHGAKVFMADNLIDSNNNTVIVTTCGSLVMSAGDRIVLRPGFRAARNCYMQALIRDCNEMPGLPGCTIILPAPVAGKIQ
jgi:murein DD-endopeptidase MepM/ murein hydrolase activator NlpD